MCNILYVFKSGKRVQFTDHFEERLLYEGMNLKTKIY